MSRSLSLVATVAGVAGLACSSPSPMQIDAPVAIDGPPADAAFCGSNLFYTGEFVDWDSSDASFHGVFNAAWVVENDTLAHNTAHTAPNGRFLLCVQAGGDPVVDITPDASDGKGYLPGAAYGRHVIIGNGVTASARDMSSARLVTMFQQIGDGSSVYDPAKGQLFIHTTNTTATLEITSGSATVPHLATQAYNNNVWAAGASGTYVYFPNIVIPGNGEVTITASSAVIGAQAIPIAAGKMTYTEVAGQ